MMSTELHRDYNLGQSWAAILELSESIEQLASEEVWEAVVKVAQQRHSAVIEHFNRFPVGPENAAFYMNNLNSFMQNEERLQILVNRARQETIQLISEFNKNRQAVNAYHAT